MNNDQATKTVLVTGGNGFIGSHFVRALRASKRQWSVANLDKLTYAGNLQNLADLRADGGYSFICGDIADPDLVSRVFEERRPEMVVHLAAESHVDRSILDSAPFIHTNVLGTHVLLEAARTFGVERFLYVSTDEVYGDLGPEGAPSSEASPLVPSSPYSVSKAAADMLCQSYHRTYGLPVVIARPSNHYGPNQYAEKLVPLMIRNALRGAPLPLYGDGLQWRDWVYVEDGVNALLAVLERGGIGRAYNIGAHQDRQNRDIVRNLCDLVAEVKRCPPDDIWRTVQHVQDRPGHDVRYALDDRRIRQETGWASEVALPDGLRRTLQWFLSHPDRLEPADSSAYGSYYETVYRKSWGQKNASGTRGAG